LLPTAGDSRWRLVRTLWISRPSPGCNAFQVDGLGFSYVLAFGAQEI
jgi:hypothetical protein